MVLEFVLSRRQWRRLAFALAVGGLHIGIVAMLMTVTRVPLIPPQPRPIQVLMLPLERRPPEKPSHPRARRARERSTAITYPPVPGGASSDTALRALGRYRDCDPERAADLPPEDRERCARILTAIPRASDSDPTLDAELRAQWSADVARKNAELDSRFKPCPGSRRSLLGLSCWEGLDN